MKNKIIISKELDELVEYLYNPFRCPNCLRLMPNLQFKRKRGCKWCQI